MGAETNEVVLITAEGEEHWPRTSKEGVAGRLAERIAAALASRPARAAE
jgi:phosphopantothenoylcysteine decarboxylase/phosphopantothenate--cysteine ligase